MSTADWEKVGELFEAALAVPSEQRDAFIDGHSGGRASVAAEVRSLLKYADAGDRFLEPPSNAAPTAAIAESVPAGKMEQIIHTCRMQCVLGVGSGAPADPEPSDVPSRLVPTTGMQLAETVRRELVAGAQSVLQNATAVARSGTESTGDLAWADLLAIDRALTTLKSEDCTMHDIVMLRLFAGLSENATAHALDRRPGEVQRDWAFARAWLYRTLQRARSSDGTGATGSDTQSMEA